MTSSDTGAVDANRLDQRLLSGGNDRACHDSSVSAAVAVLPQLFFDDSGPSPVDVSIHSRFLRSAPVSNVRMALRQARNRDFVPPQRVAMLDNTAGVPCSLQPSLMPAVHTPYFDAGQCSTTSIGVSSHRSTSQSSLIPNVRTALRQARSRG